MRLVTLAIPVLVLIVSPAPAAVPDSLQVNCDVDRTTFRKLAATPSSIAFRLWDAVSGGSQCGADHVVLMEKVLALRPKGDKFDGQRPRKFLELRAVLGTDGDSGTPVDLCSGNETWVDVTVGSTTLTCDFSADPNSKQGVLPDAPVRRRIQAIAFAQEAKHSETCDSCEGIPEVGVRVTRSIVFGVPGPDILTAIPFDLEEWDTTGMHDSAQPTRLTAPIAGTYLIAGHVLWDTTANASKFRIEFRVNGTTPIGSDTDFKDNVTTGGNTQSLSAVYKLNATDYVEMFLSQTAGATLVIPPDPNQSLSMVRLP